VDIRAILKQNPLVLAPMAGITDLPFRVICREMGAGIVYSEMVSAEALIRDQARTLGMLASDRRERPVAFQLFGSRPASLAGAAKMLSSREIDLIDINMGCPVPKVLKSGSGSALLRDLDVRGMLEDTLVIWGGEFGRTPMAQSDGRDHHIKGFSVLLAGGGIKGGISHGATDELGYMAVEDVVSVHDLHATMLHLLGIDHTKLTLRHLGRDFRLTDVHGSVVKKILT